MNHKSRTISVAPMLKRTDRHCRYFLRLIHPSVWLYTEMVTTGALLFGDQKRHLDFDACEHPIALQLGGGDPVQLAECAKIGEDWGYDEINLNVGCPSARVQSGLFGACLMKQPGLVADCIEAMQKRVKIPVTVKTRIGVDDWDTDEHFFRFIQTVSEAGCQTFIVHARKAWLKGLSPKENREIPPLQYDWVYQIKRDFPHLEVILNGGIQTVQAAFDQLNQVDGVMMGRAICQNPYLLAGLCAKGEVLSRVAVMQAYLDYVEKQLVEGVHFSTLMQPTLGLFYQQPYGKRWRKALCELSSRNVVGVKNLLDCL